MNSKLTTWLLSFALAVLLFVIIGIVLFDRMHALMRVLGRDLATLKLALGWTPGLALLDEFGDCLSAYLT
jgi:hypothetical protein